MLNFDGPTPSFDSGTNAQAFFLDAIKSLKKDHGVAASVFFLDYRLAPEYKYPSQLIETLAGYHYLVNSLGIPESKIVLGGDSAGANLASAFLLHLARPNPVIKVPESLGPTPKRPAVGQAKEKRVVHSLPLLTGFHSRSRAPS